MHLFDALGRNVQEADDADHGVVDLLHAAAGHPILQPVVPAHAGGVVGVPEIWCCTLCFTFKISTADA